MPRLPRRRTAIATTVSALVLAAAGAATAASVWDLDFTAEATDTISSFGVPNTATYGQTITVPDGPAELSTFSIAMDVPATVVFRGAVQAWDGTAGMATGPVLYLGDPTSTSGTGMETITFSPSIPITAGAYVLYTTVSYDYAVGSGTGRRAASTADPYADGQFVYMNNGSGIDALTTSTWSNIGGYDAGFTVVFAAAPVVEPPAPVAIPIVAAPAFTG